MNHHNGSKRSVTNVQAVANTDTYATPVNIQLNVPAPGVLTNDIVQGSTTINIVTPPNHGSLTMNNNGGFIYTPNNNFIGGDSFIYTVTDDINTSNPGFVAINVANQPPIAQPDSYTASTNIPLNVGPPGVLANDHDPDGHPITVMYVSGPNHGTLTLHPDGSFQYTSAINFAGTDTFMYQAFDGFSPSAPSTVTIQVTNTPPLSASDTYSTNQNTVLNVAAPGVLVNDHDPNNQPLTAVFVSGSGPSHGALTFNPDGSFQYTPQTNFFGPDQFLYQANDGITLGNPATVIIQVNSVNQQPVAQPDSYSTNTNTPLNVAAPGVLANDHDPEGQPITAVYVSGSGPNHGTLTLNSDGSFQYIPATNYFGPDSFQYKASDGSLASAATTVSIQVNNQPPVAQPDSYVISTNQLVVPAPGVLANDNDPNNQPLTAQLVSTVSHGTLTLNADGSFTYTPVATYFGPDSFQYKASDGTLFSNTVTVTITSNRVPPSTCPTKTCGSGNQCCFYYPPSKTTPIEQCFSPTTHACISDTGDTTQTKKCLCSKTNGCCNQVCFSTTSYDCTPDNYSLATKKFCLCPKNYKCCNSACYNPAVYKCNTSGKIVLL